jgi:1-deoxy-D-xylulose-5-phosphate synthase
MAQNFKQVLVIEDGIKHGGIASTLAEHGVKAESIGVPLEFIEHSKRDEILNDLGINAQTIAARMQHLVRGI